MGHEDEEEEEEEERREAAIASNPSLKPAFNSKRVSQHQLAKLHELHKRRLQIKSKIHKKLKDRTIKFHGKNPKHSSEKTSGTDEQIKDSGLPVMASREGNSSTCACIEKVEGDHALKKRQKLHWGFDTKERWERKANM